MPTPIRTDDRDPRVPALSIVLGYAPMMPIVVAALATWLAPPPWPAVAIVLGVLWSAAIVTFLAGVRRGLSFRTAGGERPVQIATMVWLFALGLGATLVVQTVPALALVLLMLGFLSIALLDPRAARRGEVPAHFARLRPPQMAAGVLALGAMLARLMLAG